jgi:hypothetical protein
MAVSRRWLRDRNKTVVMVLRTDDRKDAPTFTETKPLPRPELSD